MTTFVLLTLLGLIGITLPADTLPASRLRADAAQQSATKSPGRSAILEEWRELDAYAFSVMAPPGWKYIKRQGVDSVVGALVGDGIVLRFDIGAYSDSLDLEGDPKYLVENKKVDGLQARIVSPKQPGKGVTRIYIQFTSGGAVVLFGEDLSASQQELVLKIFSTLQFGKRH